MTPRIRRALDELLGRRGRRTEVDAGLPFDPGELERRLVWIFGSQATPARWLLQELCRPLRLDDSTPWGFDAGDISSAARALPIDDPKITTHLSPAFGVPVERDGRLVPATLNNYLGVKPAYVFARDYRDVWGPAIRRLILVRAYALQTTAQRQGLAVADSPTIMIADSGGYATDVLMSLFERSRLICLVRDGRDTVRADVDGGVSALDWACTADAILHGYRRHPSRLRRMVRYEELIAEPAASVASLREWLGLEPPTGAPAPLDEPSPPGEWRELPDEDQQAAREVMGSRLTALGYES